MEGIPMRPAGISTRIEKKDGHPSCPSQDTRGRMECNGSPCLLVRWSAIIYGDGYANEPPHGRRDSKMKKRRELETYGATFNGCVDYGVHRLLASGMRYWSKAMTEFACRGYRLHGSRRKRPTWRVAYNDQFVDGKRRRLAIRGTRQTITAIGRSSVGKGAPRASGRGALFLAFGAAWAA